METHTITTQQVDLEHDMDKSLMKKYLAVWCFLDMGMEGIPDLSNACIVNGKDEKSALKNFPKEIKKSMKGYGCATIIGEIVNDHICPRTAYPSCNDWTKDNCLEYRRAVYDLYNKVN